MKTKIIIAVILLVLMAAISLLVDINIKQGAEIERQTLNLSELGKNVQELNLTKAELKNEVIKQDTRIRMADSILLLRDIKIRQLEKLHVTTVVIENTDTMYLTNTDTLYLRDSLKTELYKTTFVDDRNCIRIEGFVMSTDEFPSVAITSQFTEIETYEMEVNRKWWQFWKKRTWKETYTKCGNLKVLDVKVK